MDVSLIFLGTNTTVSQQVTLAQQAENSGFASAYMAEAYRSCWVPLTAMAAATQTIRLGPYILNAYGHSPLMTGMAAVDFNEFSGGRLLLGIGAGNRHINEDWQGIPHERALTKMREYVTLLNRLPAPAVEKLSSIQARFITWIGLQTPIRAINRFQSISPQSFRA